MNLNTFSNKGKQMRLTEFPFKHVVSGWSSTNPGKSHFKCAWLLAWVLLLEFLNLPKLHEKKNNRIFLLYVFLHIIVQHSMFWLLTSPLWITDYRLSENSTENIYKAKRCLIFSVLSLSVHSRWWDCILPLIVSSVIHCWT